MARKALWFVGLYAAGVGVTAATAYALRWVLFGF
jgi:hypothetical protein